MICHLLVTKMEVNDKFDNIKVEMKSTEHNLTVTYDKKFITKAPDFTVGDHFELELKKGVCQ